MEYEIKPKSQVSVGLSEIWTYRELLFFFVWRDVKIKYKQTFLGALWAMLQPLLLMIVFTFLFSRHTVIESPNYSYPLFVYSGLLLWNIFSVGISNAGNSLVNNANMIKKIYFPRILLPLSSILATLVDFMVTLFLFVVMMFYFGKFPTGSMFLLVLPLVLLITLLTTTGLGAFFSAINVKYRDFRYVIPFMIQILLFLTPVIYPLSNISNELLQSILQLNPLAGAIDLLRGTFTGMYPSTFAVAQSFIVSLLLFLSGVFYFRKTENYFADFA